ncbi:MAG: LpqB family beta-propeller domain-containing protein [Acidimicrobiales bacterium]
MAPELQECEAHGTPTRLRCAEADCGQPICPRCLVKTPVGLKCEEHAQSIAPRFDRRVTRFSLGALILVAAAVVILAVAVFNQSSGPGPAPDSTPAPGASGEPNGPARIVPASVYVINADGTAARTLTNRPLAFDASPAWSPDGARIAFESTFEGKRAIWVMQADGLGLRRLTEGPGSDFAPAWSPDGARIAFMSDRDGNEEVYLIGLDGSSMRRLTNNLVPDGFPAWSPDGGRLAFVSARDGESGVWVMGADGSSPRRLVAGAAATARPAWAPDGRTIAFASDRDAGNLDIYLADVAGAGAATRVITGPGLDGEPAFSPDGARLAFASDRDGSPQIYVANRDGSNVVKLTSRARSFTPAWAPDSTKLAYIYDPAPGG